MTDNSALPHVIVAGSRSIVDVKMIRSHMNTLYKEIGPFVTVSGRAPGVDSVAYRLAVDADQPVLSMPAEWDRFGKSAGYRRNREMAKVSQHLLAFWDGSSKGTENMIEIARELGLSVTVVITGGQNG